MIEKVIVALVSPTEFLVESGVIVILVIDPALTPVNLTLEAVPFDVPPELVTVILAPPLEGQLESDVLGYIKFEILRYIKTGLELGLLIVTVRVLVALV